MSSSNPQPIPRMDSGMRTRLLKTNANNLGKVNKSRGNEETGTILYNDIKSTTSKSLEVVVEPFQIR